MGGRHCVVVVVLSGRLHPRKQPQKDVLHGGFRKQISNTTSPPGVVVALHIGSITENWMRPRFHLLQQQKPQPQLGHGRNRWRSRQERQLQRRQKQLRRAGAHNLHQCTHCWNLSCSCNQSHFHHHHNSLCPTADCPSTLLGSHANIPQHWFHFAVMDLISKLKKQSSWLD